MAHLTRGNVLLLVLSLTTLYEDRSFLCSVLSLVEISDLYNIQFFSASEQSTAGVIN